ncbi:hypothetical protein B9Z19DRAFT_682455 [Tuber borchii]|uniref:VWFA domain-containing protein n=1 Tax=Tuber borchii TaxID=42251 RepID=A0A2T6ZZF5_TUBBO|nr:hypothetical protein B9Z19DRAFT_682455 [Tuber borchii]
MLIIVIILILLLQIIFRFAWLAQKSQECRIPDNEKIREKLKGVITNCQKDLRKIYGETERVLGRRLEAPTKKGVEMAKKLIEMGCNPEVAKDLTVLTLYDVAILIDDSGSMIMGENGKRKKTLIQFVDHITEIYSMANESGILAMHFMNRGGGKVSWTGKSQEYVDHHSYGGVPRIGTALKKKILDRFAIGNGNQSKPLLVLTVTSSAVEGEKRDHLKNVIRDCVMERRGAGKGRDVLFQFTRVGKDPGAARLLRDLDKDPDLGEYIGVLPVEFNLENQLADKWVILRKVLVGAILPGVKPPHLNPLERMKEGRWKWKKRG